MALTGIQIFKLSPKKNCKECGLPTCMAFSMKVAQGAMDISACPYMSEEAIAELSEATAPPMKTIKVGTGDYEYSLGGETVLYRHEKTFVSKTRYATSVCSSDDAAKNDAKIASIDKIDYERIGEHMFTEMINVNYNEGDSEDTYLDLVKKAFDTKRTLILSVSDTELASKALDICKSAKPILNGANASNYEEMNKIAAAAGVVLSVSGKDINELYDTTQAIEKLGNKNLVLDVTGATIKETFANAVMVRRAAIKDKDRVFGYPSIVNVAKLALGDRDMQESLAASFTMKYGSVVIVENLDYAMALPLFGLRQNLFTDPQKPMKVAPGIYPINGATPDSITLTTVDFALTYFLVSGELERSGIPVNLVISDAGGLSVLTAWAAGKLSSTSVSKYFQEEVEDKITNRKVIIPGKVAVLKGDIEAKLPGWEVIVGPMEAVQLVKFLKDMKANAEL